MPFCLTLVACFFINALVAQQPAAASHNITLQLEKITVVPDNLSNYISLTGIINTPVEPAVFPANNRLLIEKKNIAVLSAASDFSIPSKKDTAKPDLGKMVVIIITATQQ